MSMKAVLLVDDEKPIREALESYLGRSGIYIKSAASSETALAEFRSTFFDLVITDFLMEGKNGIELLQEIKNINYETGVFILTGQGDLTVAIEALQSGADDFILKPCDADMLLCKMNRFFEKQDALRKIKIYEKILPVCMYCKKIRDDGGTKLGAGQWLLMEEYLCRKSGADISHGCCPECFDENMARLQKLQ